MLPPLTPRYGRFNSGGFSSAPRETTFNSSNLQYIIEALRGVHRSPHHVHVVCWLGHLPDEGHQVGPDEDVQAYPDHLLCGEEDVGCVQGQHPLQLGTPLPAVGGAVEGGWAG